MAGEDKDLQKRYLGGIARRFEKAKANWPPGSVWTTVFAIGVASRRRRIYLPENRENFLSFSTSKVTAEYMADRLEELWPALLQCCPQMHTLVIHADNGPECSGRRKQWLHRLLEFSRNHRITIKLAYYPPYHSKYNPVERIWGVLENHWRGELLNSVEKALGLPRSMTYAGVNPIVVLGLKVYHNGVTLTNSVLAKVEEKIKRTSKLEDWFLTILRDQQLG